MDRASSGGRRTRLLLLVLAAAALIVWLALPLLDDGDQALTADADLAPSSRNESAEDDVATDGTVKTTATDAAGRPPLVRPTPDVGDPAKQASSGPVDVRVVGLHGQALPAVRIRVQTGSYTSAVHRADADGRIHLKDQPYDGSARLLALDLQPVDLGRAEAVAIRGPRVTLRVPTGWPLRVMPVDAETGEPVLGVRWRVHPQFDVDRPFLTAAEGAATIYARPGGPCLVALDVEAPAGYVAWDTPVFEHHVAREARSLAIVYPLRREVTLQATYDPVEDPSLDEAAQARIRIATLESSLAPVRQTHGLIRVPGVPYFRDAQSVVRLTKATRRAAGRLRAEVLGEARVLFPADHQEAVNADAREILHRGGVNPDGTTALRKRGPVSRWRARDRRDAENEARLRPVVALPGSPGPASGTLRILRRDGRPAPGARFWMWGVARRANERGEYAFQLHAGAVRFILVEPGLVNTVLDVKLEARADQRLTLRERVGARIELEVVDEKGRPLPHARVHVGMLRRREPTTWQPTVRHTQRIDGFTDHQGRRAYDSVDPGHVTLTGTWADRAGKATLDVSEGQAVRAQLVLRPRRFRVR